MSVIIDLKQRLLVGIFDSETALWDKVNCKLYKQIEKDSKKVCLYTLSFV